MIPPNLNAYFDPKLELPGTRLDPELPEGYRSCTEEEYRKFPALNATLLKEPTLCEMLHAMQPGSEQTEAMTVGTLVHWAALEPHKIKEPDKWMVPFTATKTLTSKAAQEARAANPDKLLVTPEMIELAYKCLVAINMNPQAVELLSEPGYNEAAGFVFCPQYGIWRKCRIDRMPTKADYFLDIKTSRRELYRFEADCWERGYFIQAAWYLALHYLLTGERRRWFWIVITKEEPIMTRVIELQCPTPDSPLYKDCKLALARQRLGLDDSEKIGRVPAFITAAKETLALLERGNSLDDPTTLRQVWPGYEQESPVHTIL